jgi:hypothetical protein
MMVGQVVGQRNVKSCSRTGPGRTNRTWADQTDTGGQRRRT